MFLVACYATTSRYVGLSVGWLVPLYFFGVFVLLEHTAPAQMPW